MKLNPYPSVQLGDLFEFSSGLSKSASEFGFGHPFVTFKDVFYNYYLPERLTQLANTTASEIEKCSVRRGDVFLTRTSETMDELGTSSVALKDYPNATFNGFTKRLRPKSLDRVVPEYLVYAFRSQSFRQQVTALSTMSTRASLNNEMLARLSIPLPPVETQERIGETLYAFDQRIDLNRQMAATLEETARAIFKSWFIDIEPVRAKAEGRPTNLPPEIDALFPDSFTKENLPMGWTVTSADKEFNIVMGQSPPGSSYNKEGNGEPFYQGRSDFGFRYPTARVFCTSPKRVAAAGDTLVSVRAPVGDVNLAAEQCAIGRGVAAVRHKSGSQSFTYYSMISMKMAFNVFESEGTVFGSLGKSDFHSMQVIAPPQKLVDRFESVVGKLDEKIKCATSELLTLTELRDSLLPMLMNRDNFIESNNRLGEQPCSV